MGVMKLNIRDTRSDFQQPVMILNQHPPYWIVILNMVTLMEILFPLMVLGEMEAGECVSFGNLVK